MTPDEILLPEWAKIILIIVFAVLAYKVWTFEVPSSKEVPEVKPEMEPVEEYSPLDHLNPDYGAYVQLAGKRYN